MSYDTRSTYVDAKRKKLIREFLINQFEFEMVTGLAGPDINQYIEYMQSKGCKEFEIFEKDSSIFNKQVSTINTTANVTLKHDDILKAESKKPNTLYDLDFCTSARFMGDYMKKFKDNFIMTFCLRPVGTEETLSKFFGERNEIILKKSNWQYKSIKYSKILTGVGEYIYTSYRDTIPMCCIAKIN